MSLELGREPEDVDELLLLERDRLGAQWESSAIVPDSVHRIAHCERGGGSEARPSPRVFCLRQQECSDRRGLGYGVTSTKGIQEDVAYRLAHRLVQLFP